MAICLGAVCTYKETSMIVGVSDRKFTAGDWTYEPPQTKRYKLTDHVVLLISGDMATNSEIITEAHRKLITNPTKDVKEIANMVALAFAEYRRNEAERHLLFPRGLTLETYRKESKSIVKQIDDELLRWQLEVEALVAGIDERYGTAHLYIVSDPGWARCEDAAGFAAIGSGGGHAAAEFMRAKYQRSWSPERALLLTYRAKKSAEVDPFVGVDTDMFIIGPGLPISPLNERLVDYIKIVHAQTIEAVKTALEDADQEMEYYVSTFFEEQEEEAIEQGRMEAGDEQKQLGEGYFETEEDDEPEDSTSKVDDSSEAGP